MSSSHTHAALTAVVLPIIATRERRMTAREYAESGMLDALRSKKALDVVRSSIRGLGHVELWFDEPSLAYHITFDPKVTAEDIAFTYGDAAADTWMEGDIDISDDGGDFNEMHLELVAVKLAEA